MYMETNRASCGLESFLRKHLAWWKNTADCLLTVLMKNFASCHVIFSILLMITSEHSL